MQHKINSKNRLFYRLSPFYLLRSQMSSVRGDEQESLREQLQSDFSTRMTYYFKPIRRQHFEKSNGCIVINCREIKSQ